MNKKKWVIAITAIAIVGGFVWFGKEHVPNATGSDPSGITAYFQNIARKTAPRPDDSVLLASDASGQIKITVSQFVEYKAHKQFLYDYQGLKGFPKPKTILEEMIKRELLAAEAGKQGLTVSEEELQQYVAQQREALRSASPEIREIEQNLIRLSGMSEEAYWQSEKTLRNYEQTLAITKLTDHMQLRNSKEYERLENRLLKEADLQINTKELKKTSK